jgi:tetratricopeptide (TPR) repeat protein
MSAASDSAQYDPAQSAAVEKDEAVRRARGAARAGQRLEATRLWELARARFPGSVAVLLGSIHALSDAGRKDELLALLPAARAALDRARAHDAEPMTCLRLELAMAKAVEDWGTMRRCAQQLVGPGGARSADLWVDLANACLHLGDLPAARRAVQEARAIDPAQMGAVVVGAAVATEQGDGDAALECYQRLSELNPDSARWPLRRIQLLNWLGLTEEAIREFEALEERFGDDPTVRTFRRNFGPALQDAQEADAAQTGGPAGAQEEDVFDRLRAAAPAQREWKRPLLVPRAREEVQIIESGGSEQALLVFSGGNDGMAMPLPIFDRFLAPLPAAVVYLKDFRRLNYLLGIGQLAAGYAGTIDALRGIVDRLGARRVSAIGNCDGAFAAMRYGIELGAERVIAFDPPTHHSDEIVPRLEQARNFKRRRLAAAVPDMTDLRPFLLAANGRTQIEILFREDEARERSHAQHVADAPGVTLVPVAGAPGEAALARFLLAPGGGWRALGSRLGFSAQGRGD